jgi:hypothetical protein
LSTIPGHRANRSFPIIASYPLYKSRASPRQEYSGPARSVPKINFKTVAHFSSIKKHPSTHHVHHTIHHKLTTKNHHFEAISSETPEKMSVRRHKKNHSTGCSILSKTRAM